MKKDEQTKLYPKSQAELLEMGGCMARLMCRVAELREDAKADAKERREEIAGIEDQAFALAAEIRGEMAEEGVTVTDRGLRKLAEKVQGMGAELTVESPHMDAMGRKASPTRWPQTTKFTGSLMDAQDKAAAPRETFAAQFKGAKEARKEAEAAIKEGTPPPPPKVPAKGKGKKKGKK